MARQDFAGYLALIIASLSVGFYTGARSARRRGGLEVQDDGNGDDDECKLALIVRTDLGMSVGKIAAQCSHATLACYQSVSTANPSLVRRWERSGQPKVTLRCASEDELLLLQTEARSLNLFARSIQDAGRTQIAAGSRTVLGIGPGPARLINKITGKLRLL